MVFRRSWKDPTKPKGFRVSKMWYGSYPDANGRPKRIRLLTDKRESERLLDEHRLRVEHQRMGLIPAYDEAEKRPLSEHLDDFDLHLRHLGRTRAYVWETVGKIRRAFTACGFVYVGDVHPEAVETYLAGLVSGGVAPRTRNSYAVALRGFFRWMVSTNRTGRNPLAVVKNLNERADRRRLRRALSPDEARALTRAAKDGPAAFGLSGPHRALCYMTALGTGLRRDELKSLTWASFDLGSKPTVRVSAGNTKNRQEATLPLAESLAQALREWKRAHPFDAPVFPLPRKAAKMMHEDLVRAGILHRDEHKRIVTRDATGRTLDFHALRGTYISHLVAAGVNVKVVQGLARHATIGLTLDRYTDPTLLNHGAAVGFLPDLSPSPEREAAKATGTDGGAVGVDTEWTQVRLARVPSASVQCTNGPEEASAGNGVRTPEMAEERPSEVARPTGFEPATPGSTVRYSSQLSYGPAVFDRPSCCPDSALVGDSGLEPPASSL